MIAPVASVLELPVQATPLVRPAQKPRSVVATWRTSIPPPTSRT
jgi:hypothetical protein